MKTKILILLAIILLANCKSKNDFSDIPNQYPIGGTNPSTTGTDQIDTLQNAFIKSAYLYFSSDDYFNDLKLIKNILKHFKAQIVQEEEYLTENQLENSLTVQVPANNFWQVIDSLTNTKLKLTSKTINIQNVSKQLIDLNKRLENKKLLEQQYQKILNNATTISDILQITEYLNRVRTDIEILEAQLKNLQNQIQYYTITINITQTKNIKDKFPFLENLKEGLKAGWHLFLYFLIFIISALPFWIVLFIIIFVVKKIKRNKKNKLNAKN